MEIQQKEQDQALIINLIGEVDMHQTPSLSQVLSDAATQNKGMLVIDLSETTYMDSSGIATLVECYRKVKDTPTKFCLVNVHPKIKPIFEIMRLDKIFPIAASLEEALKTQP